MNREEAEDFLYKEARLLDDVALKEWLDLASEEFVYWIPVNDDMSDPKQHLSIIYENKHELSERVFRIVDSGLNHAQDPPSKTTRFISNVEVMPADNEEEVEFRCNLLLCEYRPHGQRGHALPARQLAARCRYRLHKQAGEWRMTQKIVAFLEMDGPLDGMTFLV